MVVAAGAYFLIRGSSRGIACGPENATRLEEVTISYGGGKFSPACLVVASGTSITWVNNSTQEIRIGADPHPIHTDNKEVSKGEFVLKLAPGEMASVIMNKKGKSGYHDHLNATASGAIIVE